MVVPLRSDLPHLRHRAAEQRLAARAGASAAAAPRRPASPPTRPRSTGRRAAQRHGRPNAQDVIIFFTDGEANYGPYVGSSPNPSHGAAAPVPVGGRSCQQLVHRQARRAAGRRATGRHPGTWIYTVLVHDRRRPRAARPPSRSRSAGIRAGRPLHDVGLLADDRTTRIPRPQPRARRGANPPMPDVATTARSSRTSPRRRRSRRWRRWSRRTSRFYPSNADLTDIFKRIAIDLSATRLLPDNTQ